MCLASLLTAQILPGPHDLSNCARLQLEATEVTPDVTARAVEAIPANLSRWREEAIAEDFAARERVLGDLEQRLRS